MTEPPVTFADPLDLTQPPGPVTLDARTAVILIAGFSAVLLLAATVLLPVKYAVLHPGPVLNTLGKSDGKSLIAISGRTTYPTTGTLDLTTVSLVGGPGRRISLGQVIHAWLDPSTAVLPEEELFPPGETQKQSDDENQAEMVSSQESATAAALSTLGITVPTALNVVALQPSAPTTLKRGDVILGVAGKPVTDLTALRADLNQVHPGDQVKIQIQRDGKTSTLTTRTSAAADDGHTVLGVVINPVFRFPFSVKIQIENIGGPSAGMMFALGIIDTLTPGDLTGGRQIAGTGTISADGTVGPIGGIRQKLVGARRAGARYFLAPADNCNEVRGHVPDGLQVVRTATLSQSEAEVKAIAAGQAAGLPAC